MSNPMSTLTWKNLCAIWQYSLLRYGKQWVVSEILHTWICDRRNIAQTFVVRIGICPICGVLFVPQSGLVIEIRANCPEGIRHCIWKTDIGDNAVHLARQGAERCERIRRVICITWTQTEEEHHHAFKIERRDRNLECWIVERVALGKLTVRQHHDHLPNASIYVRQDFGWKFANWINIHTYYAYASNGFRVQ